MDSEELEQLLREDQHGVIMPCWIQPKSSIDAIAGVHGDAIKITITAPPVDGKANEHLCKCVAKLAGIPKSSVELVSGMTSRRKVIRLYGITKAELLTLLHKKNNSKKLKI